MSEPFLQENTNMPDISAYKDLSIDDLVKFNIVNTIYNANNPTKFCFMVMALEDLLADNLPKDYDEKVKNEGEKLLVEHGSKTDKWNFGMAHFKYRLLMSHIKDKIPKEVETEI